MLFKELRNQISKGIMPSNKFILYSKDEYSIKSIINILKSQISMPELNVTEIDLDCIEFDDIVSKCETLPFMGKKRLILIKANFLEEDNKDKLKISDSLSKYLNNLPDFTTLVMYFYQKDKRENIIKNKKIKKFEKAGVILVTNSKTQTSDVKEIVDDFLKTNNMNLDKNVKNYIISSSNNLDLLNNDLNKLKFVSSPINIELIKSIFSSLEEDDVFDLTDSIGKKNGVKALEVLNNLLAKGVQPMQIVNNLIRQYKLLLYCKASLSQKETEEEIAKKFGLHPYSCKILCTQSNAFELERLAQNLKMCIDLEVKIKSISIDTKSELELLLINSLT